jgi:hypothetical protein
MTENIYSIYFACLLLAMAQMWVFHVFRILE